MCTNSLLLVSVAYCKYHSTETALSYIHDHLINAIGSQNFLSLSSDLSAAFDTIDHNILITCLLSWFGIHGSVLNWFKSYHHLALSVLNVINATLPPIPVYVVFPKVLFLVPYFSSCLSLLYH